MTRLAGSATKICRMRSKHSADSRRLAGKLYFTPMILCGRRISDFTSDVAGRCGGPSSAEQQSKRRLQLQYGIMRHKLGHSTANSSSSGRERVSGRKWHHTGRMGDVLQNTGTWIVLRKLRGSDESSKG